MANWEVVPCLDQLRDELNEVAPNRDRKSDGTIGDRAHQQSVSDHNDDEVGRVPIRDDDANHEVHAYDADADLRTPGLTMEDVVQHILARCRSGEEKRLRYIIFNKRIWEASNGWRQRKYTGASPHTEHAHFSASYQSKHEASRASWKLEEIEVALSDTDLNKIAALIDKRIDQAIPQIVEAVWKKTLNVKVGKGEKPSMQEAGNILRYGSSEHHSAIDEARQAKEAATAAKTAANAAVKGVEELRKLITNPTEAK